jgi:hypothetical protein
VRLEAWGNYTITGVRDDHVHIPSQFELYQNYPNPFNPTTNIEYHISHFGFVSLTVYDVLGRRIATLVNEFQKPGDYKVQFNKTSLPSGVYFYRLESGSFSETKKMFLFETGLSPLTFEE